MRRLIIFVLAIMILISCAAQAKPKNNKPEWLNNPKSAYPEQMYLTAIGEGDSRSQAEDYAAANLAKIFESNVSADETYLQQYKEVIKNGDVDYSDESDIMKSVNIKSDQKLYNIQFAESFTDNVGRVHVLAYLNRLQTAQIYEEKIEKNSITIKYYQKQSLVSSNKLSAYAAMNMAAVYSAENEYLMKQLEIIHSASAEFIELDYDYNEITRLASQLAHNITFAIDVKNDAENKLGIMLEEMFTEMGFTMGEKPDLMVNGNIDFENADLNRDDFKFIRYDVQLKISDRSGVIVAALNEKGKEGHTTYTEAEARAVRKINKKIDTSLRKKVIDYFNSLVASQPKY